MDQVEWWWNGRWGRLARRDVWLKTDGSSWRVEARQGGSEGRLWGQTYASQTEARGVLEAMKARASDAWTELSKARG